MLVDGKVGDEHGIVKDKDRNEEYEREMQEINFKSEEKRRKMCEE